MRGAIVEAIGTALLLAVVTGSGLMGESLASGNAAIALLGNSIATGAGLYVLITLLGPLSGAHFNPVVSFFFWAQKSISIQQFGMYVVAQCLGAIAGVWLTHLMFGLPVLQSSMKVRSGVGILVSECVATVILLTVIKLGVRQTPEKVPMLVALVVTAGYWFTSSTFFCNPAVTLARSMTNTFVGIRFDDVGGFIAMQLLAVGIVLLVQRFARSQASD